MFKTGDKIMVRGYEGWGEGEIRAEHHDYHSDIYAIYFPNRREFLTSCDIDSFYQTLEQQTTSNLTAYSTIREIAKDIINKGNIEFEFKNGSTIRTIQDIQDNDNTHRSSGWGLISNYNCIDKVDLKEFFKNHTTNKGDKSKMMGFNFGDKVKYVSRPDFGMGVVVSKTKDKLYSIIFEKFSATPQSIHISDLLPYDNEQRGKRSEMMLFENFNINMPDIVDYNYNEDTTVTTIWWSDGTNTKVRAEYRDTASQHEGFKSACAKKAFGNDNMSNKLYDKWVVKEPVKKQKAQIKANEKLLEEQRIAEKRKAKKEKWLIRKRAVEINREYEAKKLAHEKYGVPLDEKGMEQRK